MSSALSTLSPRPIFFRKHGLAEEEPKAKTMKPICCLNFDLQIQRTETGFRSQVLNSPAGEASGSCGAIFTDVELENYLLKLGRPRRAHSRRIDSPEYAVA